MTILSFSLLIQAAAFSTCSDYEVLRPFPYLFVIYESVKEGKQWVSHRHPML